MTEQEAVLKVWKNYFKELLNQERNNNDLELPSYVEGKVELTDITDTKMQTGMKGMKKGRAPGFDEMRVEKIQWQRGRMESAVQRGCCRHV